jgi:hypothetical protein
MSVASRVRGFGAKAEQPGICLDDHEPWCLGPAADAQRFVRALPLLVPDGTVAYFEGTSDPRVAAFLGRFATEPTARVVVAPSWPRPDFYHLPITTDLMEALARFLEESEIGFFCRHALAYRDGTVLLQWREAFTDAPLQLSRALPDHAVRSFAAAIGSRLR